MHDPNQKGAGFGYFREGTGEDVSTPRPPASLAEGGSPPILFL